VGFKTGWSGGRSSALLAPVISLGTTFTANGGTVVWAPVLGATGYSLLRDSVVVGPVTSPYAITTADVGPAITVEATAGARTSPPSNALQYTLPSANIKGDWNSYGGDGVSYILSAGFVTTAIDQSGAGNNLTNANPGTQPTIAHGGAPDGVHDAFDFALNAGVGVALYNLAMGLSSPVTIYTIAKAPPATRYIYDGASVPDTRITYGDGTHLVNYAGAVGPQVPVTPGVWYVIASVFNGAASKASVNGGAQVAGNVGASVDAGHYLGGRAGNLASAALNGPLTRNIVYAAAHSAATVVDISAYLAWWGSV